jgi:hypothetical protein
MCVENVFFWQSEKPQQLLLFLTIDTTYHFKAISPVPINIPVMTLNVLFRKKYRMQANLQPVPTISRDDELFSSENMLFLQYSIKR